MTRSGLKSFWVPALLGMLTIGCADHIESGPNRPDSSSDAGANPVDTAVVVDASQTVDIGPARHDSASPAVPVPKNAQQLAEVFGGHRLTLNSSHLYWTTPSTRTVHGTPRKGGPVAVIAEEFGVNEPTAITFRDGWLYWAALNPKLYFVRRLAIGQKTQATVTTGKPAAAEQTIVAIAVDDASVYYVTGSAPGSSPIGQVRRVQVGDGTPIDIAIDQKQPTAIALAGPHVYWTTRSGPAIQRALKMGGEVASVVVETTGAVALSVDQSHVFWCNEPGVTVDLQGGTIMRAQRGGGTATILASGQDRPVAIAIDGSHVWWLNAGVAAKGLAEGALMRHLKDVTGPPESVLVGLHKPVDLQVGDDAIFWLTATTQPSESGPAIAGGLFRLNRAMIGRRP